MKHRLAARLAALSAGAILAGGVFFFRATLAQACGCFTPPDPTAKRQRPRRPVPAATAFNADIDNPSEWDRWLQALSSST